jgi:hypothetical protein
LFFADLRTWFDSRTPWEKAAIVIWGVILLFVSVRVFLMPESKTVYPIFSASGRFWWTSTELYEPHRPTDVQDGWRYGPTCAVLFTPFAIFPDSIGGALWRLFSVATLLGALAWFSRSVLPTALSAKHFAMLLLFILPLSIQSVNNGQTNLVVMACMLGAVAAVTEQRWNLVSLLIALAFICKLYPLALGMILILLYPRHLWWRIPAACLASVLFPFLCQHPAYVVDQYEKWITLIRFEDRSNIQLEHMYRDLWLLIRVYGVPISRELYLILQITGGAVVALLCWQRQRAGWPTSALLTSTLALTTAWIMLLGPATESSSFALLAPSFAWSVINALETKQRSGRHHLLWASCFFFAVAVFIGGIFSGWRIHETGVHAWGSLCYFAYLLMEPRPSDVQAAQQRDQRIAA